MMVKLLVIQGESGLWSGVAPQVVDDVSRVASHMRRSTCLELRLPFPDLLFMTFLSR